MVLPFVPPAVHTAAVVVVNDTARPDVAVAPTVTSVPGGASARAPKLIVWPVLVTVKLCPTAGAML